MDSLLSAKEAAACKGLFFRYRETFFVTTRGGVKHIQETYPLKRQSCPGCTLCGGVEDFLREFPDSLEIDAAAADGDLLQLFVKVDSVDWETGHADDWHVVAEVVRA